MENLKIIFTVAHTGLSLSPRHVRLRLKPQTGLRPIPSLPQIFLSFLIFLLISPSVFSQWVWQNPLPQGNYLSSVYFTDANTGYAVGLYGTILKTSNGGTVFIQETTLAVTNLIVYPNPCSGSSIYVAGKGNSSNVIHTRLYTMAGTLIRADKFNVQNPKEIDISGCKKGMYILNIHNGNEIVNRKVVIQ